MSTTTSLFEDRFYHGGYLLEKQQVSDIFPAIPPYIMETETVKAYRM